MHLRIGSLQFEITGIDLYELLIDPTYPLDYLIWLSLEITLSNLSFLFNNPTILRCLKDTSFASCILLFLIPPNL